MAGLDKKTLQEAHEVAREEVRAAKKSIKRDYDLHMRKQSIRSAIWFIGAAMWGKTSNPFGWALE